MTQLAIWYQQKWVLKAEWSLCIPASLMKWLEIINSSWTRHKMCIFLHCHFCDIIKSLSLLSVTPSSSSFRPRRVLNERFLGQLEQRCVLQGLRLVRRPLVRPAKVGCWKYFFLGQNSRFLAEYSSIFLGQLTWQTISFGKILFWPNTDICNRQGWGVTELQ